LSCRRRSLVVVVVCPGLGEPGRLILLETASLGLLEVLKYSGKEDNGTIIRDGFMPYKPPPWNIGITLPPLS
jgi:hypothetical protein